MKVLLEYQCICVYQLISSLTLSSCLQFWLTYTLKKWDGFISFQTISSRLLNYCTVLGLIFISWMSSVRREVPSPIGLFPGSLLSSPNGFFHFLSVFFLLCIWMRWNTPSRLLASAGEEASLKKQGKISSFVPFS